MATEADNLDHRPLAFGKYKGRTPSDIAETEEGAKWLKWAYENVSNRSVCSELLARDCGYKLPYSSQQGQAAANAIIKNTGFSDDFIDDDIPF